MASQQDQNGISQVFSARALTPFGIEIDFDLRQPLTPLQQMELQRLRHGHRLLVFRNQSLDLKEHERVMAYLGPVLTDIIDRMDYVSSDMSVGAFGTGIITFHSDLGFTSCPFHSISLHAKDVVDGATSTSFADAVRTLGLLPPALRARLEGRQVLNCIASDNEGRARDQNVPVDMPRTTHALVSRHPLTGERLLMCNYQQSMQVVGLSEPDSEALLAEIYSYLYAPENIYEHRWCKGDLIIWDNIGLHHGRLERVTTTRTLQRVTGGEVGLIALYPAMRAIYEAYVAKNLARHGAQKAS